MGNVYVPDHTKLKIGDRIRILKVPNCDLEQRKHEIAKGLEDDGWTANTIEGIIAQDPVVTISMIDEYGQGWFEYQLITEDGQIEEHWIAIMDDDSWEYA